MGKWIREGLRFVNALRTFGRPYALTSRYRHLYFDRSFSPNEIHFFRLLDPSLDHLALDCFSSKEELLKVQCILNPPELHSWTEDKLYFHTLSIRYQLPVPHLLAVLSTQSRVESAVPVVEHGHEFIEALRSSDAHSMILKPVKGVHGEGVARLVRSEGEWIDSRGNHFTEKRLEKIIATSGYTEWMLQEKVIGHDLLAQLSDTKSLQTCRIVTLLDEKKNVEILAARLRLICDENDSDNFSYGSTGNIIAILDSETGRIASAFTGSGRDPQLTRVTVHPRTGRKLTGFSVPAWSSVRELAIRAARAFAPLRTIGWDVAVGKHGTVIIEGNVTWDTLSGDQRMGEIHRRLKVAAERSAAQPEQGKTAGTTIANHGAVQQNDHA